MAPLLSKLRCKNHWCNPTQYLPGPSFRNTSTARRTSRLHTPTALFVSVITLRKGAPHDSTRNTRGAHPSPGRHTVLPSMPQGWRGPE